MAAHRPLRRFPGVAYLGCCNASTPVSTPAAGAGAGTGSRMGGTAAATAADEKKQAACFSKARVTRTLPADAAAAATCVAASASAAAATPAARRAIAAGATLLGKYRSEVEVAVQHALALGLPGAEYAPPAPLAPL